MAFRFGLLVLPALVFADIEVIIYGQFKEDKSDIKVWYDGYDFGRMTVIEQNTFNLSDYTLKNIAGLCYGRRPDDVYVRGPTPWGNLYKKYGFNEIARFFKPEVHKILNISSEHVTIFKQIFKNNSQKQANFSFGLAQENLNTVRSSWNTEGPLSINKKISYIIEFNVGEEDRKIFFSYNSSWCENVEKSQEVTLGSGSVINLVLNTGQSVMTQLDATRGRIQTEMKYEATVSGELALNYAQKYKEHHFHRQDLEDCMEKVGLKNQVVSREIIDAVFYAKSKIIVQDMRQGNKLMEVTL